MRIFVPDSKISNEEKCNSSYKYLVSKKIPVWKYFISWIGSFAVLLETCHTLPLCISSILMCFPKIHRFCFLLRTFCLPTCGTDIGQIRTVNKNILKSDGSVARNSWESCSCFFPLLIGNIYVTGLFSFRYEYSDMPVIFLAWPCSGTNIRRRVKYLVRIYRQATFCDCVS